MENPYQPPTSDVISSKGAKARVDGTLLVVYPNSTLPRVCLRTGVACTEADRVALDLSPAASDRWSFKVNGFVSGPARERWFRNKRVCSLGFFGCFLLGAGCFFVGVWMKMFWLVLFSALAWLIAFMVFATWRQRLGMMGLHVERMRAGEVWVRGCHPEALRQIEADG